MKATKYAPLILAVLTIGCSTLIVRLFRTPLDSQGILALTNYETSFFAAAKALAVIALGAVALLWCVLRIDRRPLHWLTLATGLLMITTIASALVSPELQLAIYGFPRTFEGGLVLLAYLGFFAAMQTSPWCGSHLEILRSFLLFLVALIAGIGFLEYYGINVFNWPGISSLVYGGAKAEFLGDPRWKPAGQVSATLMYGNYVGSFLALVTPLLMTSRASAANSIHNALLLTFLFIIGLLAYCAQSRAGWIGLGAGFVYLTWQQHSRRGLLYLLTLAAAFAIGQRYMQKDSADFNRKNARGIAMLNAIADGSSSDPKYKRFREVTVQGPRARIQFRDVLLDITAVGSDIVFSDHQGHFLSTAESGPLITLRDERYQNWQMVREVYGPHKVLRLNIETFQMPLVLAEDEIRVLALGNAYTSEVPKTAWQPSLIDHLLSARLYIWNRTLPLLQDALFLGHGPGMFPILFPQRDFVGKLNAYNVHGIIVDKPHNLFLQQWFQSGLLHMLIFAGMTLAILHKTWRRKEPIVQGMGAGIVGYLVAGLANDSVVAVAPTFWIFLGILAAHAREQKEPLTTKRTRL